MRALVIYESMFGNTQAIAEAIGKGIGATVAAEVVEVADAPATIPADIGLLVVGGPTMAHGMSTRQSRADAAARAEERLVSRGQGIREWLGALAAPPSPVAAATFDTRLNGPELLWGSAAKGAAKRLRALGFRIVAPPRSFLVGGPTGSMFDRITAEEAAEARAWGEGLAATVRPAGEGTPGDAPSA